MNELDAFQRVLRRCFDPMSGKFRVVEAAGGVPVKRSDANGILEAIYDEDAQAIRVTVVP